MKFRRYYLLSLVCIPLCIIFQVLETAVTPKYDISCPLDAYIPFVPSFIIFYLLWFVYMGVSALYFMLYSKEDFLKLILFLTIGMLLAFLTYAIFPNGQSLRPADAGSSVFGRLVTTLQAVDRPNNVCPSIHVINTFGVYICTKKSRLFEDNRWIKIGSFIMMVLITMSTVFLKQHSLVDVVVGFAYAAAVYGIVFGLLFGNNITISLFTDQNCIQKK